MPYSIDRYNGTTIAVVEDGTIDSTLDLKLVGKNYAGYGEAQNENFVWLLENFASPNSPPRPLSGQLWYDSSNRKLKFYDNSKWRTTGGAEVGDTPPAGLTIGDFWFDTENEQMFAWNGAEFLLIGPQGIAGQGATQMRSRSLKDTNGALHAVIEAVADGVSLFIYSPDEFTLDDTTNPITGFSLIKQGVTMCYTPDTGVTTTDHVYWGTASNSLKLDGYAADEFLLKGNPIFENKVTFKDPGFVLGDSDDLAVYINNGTDPIIKNAVSETMTFQTTTVGTGDVNTPIKLEGAHILPGLTATSDIGSSALKYKTVYAGTFDGAATKSDSLNVGGTYRTASISAGANTVAIRDASGDLTANLFKGTATSARYADLAEKYLTDKEYEVGTVIAIGGELEATAANTGDRAIGVISENPAFMMNSEADGQYIALKGRVPVKVEGEVRKGERLVAYRDGRAIALSKTSDQDKNAQFVFAIALESCYNDGNNVIEAIIL